MHYNYSDERPKDVEYCDIVELEQRRAGSQDYKQVKGGSGSKRTLYLLRIKPAKAPECRDREWQNNYDRGAAAPTPNFCRYGLNGQQ
jgi:hypothetical protein